MRNRICITVAAAVPFVLFSHVGPAAADGAASGCRADRTPGVVTRWEFNHVGVGMTRHQVTCLFGTSGRVTAGHWGSDGRFHEVVTYRTPNTKAEVQFRDTNSSGDDYHARRTFWYPKDPT